MKDVDYKLRFKSGVATTVNFRSILTDRPYVLHFSGHGLLNTKKHLGIDYNNYQLKGNALLLEDEQCSSKYYFEQDLKTLLKECKYTFEVVFISSCHSEGLSDVFLKAGAKHVVCIMKSETIRDSVSLKFAKVFYETLFKKKLTVCQSFNIAKNSIKEDMVGLEGNEAKKYILRIQEEAEDHQCRQFLVKSEGKYQDKTTKPMYVDIPSPIMKFIGRQFEMFEIIKLLREFRVVSVLGPLGIGKYTLVRSLANHLIHRNIFSDGIIHISANAYEPSHKFFERLALKIFLARQDQQRSDLDDSSDTASEQDLDKNLLQETNINEEEKIIDELKNKSVLLILGNIEFSAFFDHDHFNKIIASLLQACPKLKILLYLCEAPNFAFETEAKEFILSKMSGNDTWELLESRSRVISYLEKKKLLDYELPVDKLYNKS